MTELREKINALRAYYGAGPTAMTDEQIAAGREVYGAKKEVDMVIVDELHEAFMRGKASLDDEFAECANKIAELTAERDEWKAKAEQAERAMNAAAGKWARADDENRELRKMLLLDDGTVKEYTERADPLTALAYQKQLAEEWRDRCHNAEALCDKLEAERDELSDKIGEITDEGSELMKKQPYTFDVHDVPGSLQIVGRYIDELTAECDGWKAKAEAKSAKRAAAVERLNSVERATDENLLDAILGAPNGMTLYGAEKLVALKALLTDEPMDGERDTNGACPDAMGQASDENATCNNSGVFVTDDSREKLEADIWAGCEHLTTAKRHALVNVHWCNLLGWLDRQAAITEREFWECHANGNQWEAHQYEARCMELTAERDALARDLAECDESRIEFRDQRDHAEEMLAQMERERDYWKLHADCWADKCSAAEAERDAYHERAVELEIELAQANGILKNTTHNHAAAKAKYERALADAARAREKQLEAERRYAELLEKPPEGAWAERIANLEAGNEELREKLSEAIGHAHEIGKLGDLELKVRVV